MIKFSVRSYNNKVPTVILTPNTTMETLFLKGLTENLNYLWELMSFLTYIQLNLQ